MSEELKRALVTLELGFRKNFGRWRGAFASLKASERHELSRFQRGEQSKCRLFKSLVFWRRLAPREECGGNLVTLIKNIQS